MNDLVIRPCSDTDLDELAVMHKQLIEDEKHDNPMDPGVDTRQASYNARDCNHRSRRIPSISVSQNKSFRTVACLCFL